MKEVNNKYQQVLLVCFVRHTVMTVAILDLVPFILGKMWPNFCISKNNKKKKTLIVTLV